MFGINFNRKKTKTKSQRRSQMITYTSPYNFTQFVTDGSYASLADNPDVRIAVSLIAELVSNMSLHLMENNPDGDKRVNNQLAHLIDVNPAKGMTRKTWMAKLINDLYLFGDGNSLFQIVAQPGSDYLSEMRPLDMSQVSYKYDTADSQMTVLYGGKELSMDGLVHFLINPDPQYPLIGTGYQRILSSLLRNLSQAQQVKSEFMTGKNMPSVIVKVDADSEELASKAGRDKVADKYLNSTQGPEPWIIPADTLDVTTVKPLTLRDIALNESVEIDKKTVAAMFGLPPFMLGLGQYSKEQYNTFINTRIAGLGQMIAQTLTKDILLNPAWYFAFNPRSLYNYDAKELAELGQAMVDRAAMGRNEWRSMLGLDPRDDMKNMLMLENYLPVDKLGDQKKLNDTGSDAGTDSIKGGDDG
ncbi:phage portal protein [Lacticaseibacillus paracasei]|uniref:Phage portal protein n=1 Tax=Lacticaseibacillus paracasei TaxID=1597 RepID=A0ABD7BS92_LACPA|nr:phage portal protein [Lacticaseibacillus paracasei]QOP54933.1 phage portal protein [Lacticaseibacillus paracasei]